MKTTKEINKWFFKELGDYEYSNQNEDINKLNIKLEKVANKKWYSEEEYNALLQLIGALQYKVLKLKEHISPTRKKPKVTELRNKIQQEKILKVLNNELLSTREIYEKRPNNKRIKSIA